MKMRNTGMWTLGVVLLVACIGSALAVEPPTLINFEGVLRDNAGLPVNGSPAMTFHFYDSDGGGCPAAGGTLLISDQHATVSVTGGLFNVALGSGTLIPGSTSFLANVFTGNAAAYVEIEVGGEILCPRVRVLSSAYAINASTLDGRSSSGFINTTSQWQTKSGNLSVWDLYSLTGRVNVNPGGYIDNSGSVLKIQAGESNSDDLFLYGGNDGTDGAVVVFGDGPLRLRAGDGSFELWNGATSTETLHIDAVGNLTTVGSVNAALNVDSGNDVTVTGAGSNIVVDNGGGIILDSQPCPTCATGVGNALQLQNGADIAVTGTGSNIVVDNGGGIVLDSQPCPTCATGVGNALQLQNGADIAVTGTGSNIVVDAGAGIVLDPDPCPTCSTNSGNALQLQNGAEFRASGASTNLVMDTGSALIFDTGPCLECGTQTGNAIVLQGGSKAKVTGTGSNITLELGGDMIVDGGTSTGSDIRLVNGGQINATGAGSDVRFESGAEISLDGTVTDLVTENGGGMVFEEDTVTSIGGTGRYRLVGPGTAGSDARVMFGQQGISSSYVDTSIGGLNTRMSSVASIRLKLDDLDIFGAFNTNLLVTHNGSEANEDLLLQLDGAGELQIAGSLTESAFDLAESFLMAEPVEPGDLVRVSPDQEDAIHLTVGESDPAVLGVVSSEPGIVLGGGAFSPKDIRHGWGDEVENRFERLRPILVEEILREIPELVARTQKLESFEAYAAASYRIPPGTPVRKRGEAGTGPRVPGISMEDAAVQYEEALKDLENTMERFAIQRFFRGHFAPVALSGRVPVKVDTSFGEIEPGDYLTPSSIPGVAMKATVSGPTIGTALESFSGGRGMVMAFIHRGHYAPTASIEATQSELAAAVDDRTPDPVTGTQALSGNLQIVLDRDGSDEARFSVFRNGEEGLGDEVFRVDEHGNVFAKGSLRPASMDVAEYFSVSETVEAGHVLVADLESPGHYRLGRRTADPAVVGVVAAEPGVLLGSGMDRIAASNSELAAEFELARRAGDRRAEALAWNGLENAFRQTHAPVALSGTVDVKADAGFGAIQVGDLLTTSPTSGHAMRSDDPAPGTILGKALESLNSGTGSIRMLVMLR
ncbi:MAG: hypothetical protein GY722_08835 [bacterium]|nr:hypothetical protein [bacterium]